MTLWAQRYIGVPWADRGRDINGLDCWGLVRIVLKDERGIDVPSYGEISATELMKVTETIKDRANAEPWRPVDRSAARAFDVVLLRGRPLHVGIMVTPEKVLHVEEKTDSVLVSLSHPSLSFRVLGFRRHKDLLDAAA